MKRKLLSVASLLVCVTILTSCGGGNNSSKLKKNEYLGNLPAIYEAYNANMESIEKKIETEGEKLMAGGEKNYGKIQKLFDDQKNKEKELKEKLQAEVKAEVAKITGKEVPASYSEKLKESGKLYYDVSQVKIVDDKGEPKLSFVISAKEDFTVPSMKAYDYNIFYRLIGTQGAPLKKATSVIIPIKLDRKPIDVKKGDVLSEPAVGFSLKGYAADRATFSGIEFISEEEYNKK